MSGVCLQILFLRFKDVFREAADRANPILGYILPSCAGSNAVFLIAYFGVIYITAGANIFHHNNLHSAAEYRLTRVKHKSNSLRRRTGYNLKRSKAFVYSSISHTALNINIKSKKSIVVSAGTAAFKKLINIKAFFRLILNKSELVAQLFCILAAKKCVHNTAFSGDMKGASEYPVR